MARQVNEIVCDIIKSGNCILIIDGKKFGMLMGELLKMLRVAEEDKDEARELFMECDQMVDDLKKELTLKKAELTVVRLALERRTPEGLKDKVASAIMTAQEVTL